MLNDGQASTGTAPSGEARDLRLYFIRGLALFIIFIDHNGFGWISRYTLRSYSFIDAADVFFVVSGYVSGLVYGRVLLTGGFWPCLRKAMRRCLELYAAEISLTLVCLVLIDAASLWHVRLPLEVLHIYRDLPAETTIGALTMTHAPPFLGLLPVYVTFIALTPLAVWLCRRHPIWLAAPSVVCYLAVQIVAQIKHSASVGWFFNPFAWQVLFFGGLLLGGRRVHGSTVGWRPSAGLVAAATIGLCAIAVRLLIPGHTVALLMQSTALQSMSKNVAWTGKHNLEPLRLLNMVLWVVVLAGTPTMWRFLRSGVAQVVIRCGQTSLAVYWAGIALNYLGMVWIGFAGTGKMQELFWTLAGGAGLVATSVGWSHIQLLYRRQTSEAAGLALDQVGEQANP